MHITSYKELDLKEKKLIDEAREALKNGYNPYSKVKVVVGAAVMTSTGKFIRGSSIRARQALVNLCAERAAVAAANSQGHRDIYMLAVTMESEQPQEEPVTPCGLCRQFLLEVQIMSGKELTILCSNGDGSKIYRLTLAELLPYGWRA